MLADPLRSQVQRKDAHACTMLDTLAQLKMKIHARQGVHPRDQVLTHNGAQLRADGMTMQALGIADGARLHLVITDISPC